MSPVALDLAPDVVSSGDAYARRFAGRAGRLFLDRQEEVIAGALADKQGVSILDVGGGHAQLSGPLSARGHQVTVSGSTAACGDRLSRDPRNADVAFRVAALDRLPFESQAFDTVISIRLMAHVADWRAFLGELCRVAQQSVVIDYPDLASVNALSFATFALKRWVEGDTREYRNFTAAMLTREFARHGFRVRGVERQFVLPMALHRALRAPALLSRAEQASARIGLTRRFGNPGVMRADRAAG